MEWAVVDVVYQGLTRQFVTDVLAMMEKIPYSYFFFLCKNRDPTERKNENLVINKSVTMFGPFLTLTTFLPPGWRLKRVCTSIAQDS